MSRRLTIGLRYTHQDQWVGGLYYVRNLVTAMGLLPASQRPRLLIVGGDKAALADLAAATGYPDLGRISRTRIDREPVPRLRLPFSREIGESIDLILMGAPPGLEDRGVHWTPDFQESRFPEFFPPQEVQTRRRLNEQAFAGDRHLMVSSRDAAGDLARYYGRGDARVHVVHFASFLPVDVQPTDAPELRRRYGLPERYFLCANQAWKHKNHGLILRALALTPAADRPTIAFTGKEDDPRDPDYAPSLRRLAKELGVADRTAFLGFLPRTDQLGLMAGSVAVIQPSLCEGWSTVVEDAKALGRHVLASEIAVHREQLDRNADFFAPDQPAGLARLLDRYRSTDPVVRPLDYGQIQHQFARDLWAMIVEVERDLRRRRIDRLVIRR